MLTSKANDRVNNDDSSTGCPQTTISDRLDARISSAAAAEHLLLQGISVSEPISAAVRPSAAHSSQQVEASKGGGKKKRAKTSPQVVPPPWDPVPAAIDEAMDILIPPAAATKDSRILDASAGPHTQGAAPGQSSRAIVQSIPAPDSSTACSAASSATDFSDDEDISNVGSEDDDPPSPASAVKTSKQNMFAAQPTGLKKGNLQSQLPVGIPPHSNAVLPSAPPSSSSSRRGRNRKR